ncbi:MAG: hypothetical protein M0019_03075 [Actinomycetota bacterium]|nr:hypothetical protein [Actinomycetota bacterium]
MSKDLHPPSGSGEIANSETLKELKVTSRGELGELVLRTITDRADKSGLVFGVYPVRRLMNSYHLLNDRKAKGLNGSMQFTYRNPLRSTSPDRIIPGARSIVTFALPIEHLETQGDLILPRLLARYARRDYYGILRRELESVHEALGLLGVNSKVVLDSNELIDKEVAVRSGVGSYLKNSLVNVAGFGSFTVIGSLVLDVALPRTLVKERLISCGRCQICIEQCPTSAIGADGAIDARRCISWLLQSPEDVDPKYLAAIGTRLYGCDICQEVCPINRRSIFHQEESSYSVDETAIEILQVLKSSDSQLLELLNHIYIHKRDVRLVRRNAIIAAANLGPLSAFEDEIVSEIAKLKLADSIYQPYIQFFNQSRGVAI